MMTLNRTFTGLLIVLVVRVRVIGLRFSLLLIGRRMVGRVLVFVVMLTTLMIRLVRGLMF